MSNAGQRPHEAARQGVPTPLRLVNDSHVEGFSESYETACHDDLSDHNAETVESPELWAVCLKSENHGVATRIKLLRNLTSPFSHPGPVLLGMRETKWMRMAFCFNDD